MEVIMEQIITLEDAAGLMLTQEFLQQIGVSVGDKVEVKIANGTLTVRPLEAAERARKIAELTKEIFDNRREAYLQLAQGPK
jgi:antitoxin component of MazEF toxin-antitoxin module